MSQLDDASAWLTSTLLEHVGTDVVYKRGADSVELTGTKGQTVFEIEDSTGIVQRLQGWDWLFDPADVVLSGAAVTPAPGDKIEQTIGSTTYTYQVLDLGRQQCWRLDPDRRSLRVHTKLIGTA